MFWDVYSCNLKSLNVARDACLNGIAFLNCIDAHSFASHSHFKPIRDWHLSSQFFKITIHYLTTISPLLAISSPSTLTFTFELENVPGTPMFFFYLPIHFLDWIVKGMCLSHISESRFNIATNESIGVVLLSWSFHRHVIYGQNAAQYHNTFHYIAVRHGYPRQNSNLEMTNLYDHLDWHTKCTLVNGIRYITQR